jgi:hypothetical protein
MVCGNARPPIFFFFLHNNRQALYYCARKQATVSQPASPPEKPTVAPFATSAEFEFIRINSISARTEPEGNPPANEPDQPTAQPVATLSEPICPYCSEILEPDQSGLTACLGCGRLFRVEIPLDNPDGDDGDDETPPESPDDGDGSPPKTPSNGHRGQSGFAPPKTSIPPAFPSGNRIYSNKFNLPAFLNRMTEKVTRREYQAEMAG